MATIQDFLAKTQLPEPALAPITSKLDEYIQLVTQNNAWVAQINATKAQDPNNVEFLDSRWKAEQAANNPQVAELAAQFDAIAEEYEKKLAQLRAIAKENFIPEALSEDEAKNVKKKVNEAAPAIATARQAALSMLEIPTSILTAMKVELPENGLASLLPNAESLKNIRGGRKAATGEKIYATRVGEILLDGKSTNIDGKGKIAYAADKLSEIFNAANVPANKVTTEELETAYFASLPGDVEFRSLSSTEIPVEHTFTFEKNVLKQNPNDEGFTEAPMKVNVTVRNVNYGKTEAQPNEETPAENKVETPAEKPDAKPEAKNENKPEAKQEVPAKKAAPAPAKK